MKIAVIDNYDSFVYNLVRYIREESRAEIKVMRNTHVDYDFLNQASAILLSPGPGIPNQAGDLMKIIDSYASQKNILGVCLGHQALGQYYGWQLKPAQDIVHGKASLIDIHARTEIFEHLNEKEQVGRYHSWIVEPSEEKAPLKITASATDGEIMAMQHESLAVYGIQFHPESILTPAGRKMIRNWIKTIK
ncbi:MAG: aminodeoxychorismate/anthranilate synthase component II [Crocinitomicaceae bacterium]|jgi:anthranilate synthase component 2|nr:aminodeoxychorismate/anthranilate synthase component II [Crocinitomicaceae bacterium]